MQKKILAITLSTSLMFNPLQMAFATTTTEAVDPMIQQAIERILLQSKNPEAIAEMVRQAGVKVTPQNVVEMKAALEEVKKLRTQLNTILKTNQTDSFLAWADFMQFVLASANTVAGQMHATSEDKAHLTLIISAVSAALNSAVRNYKLKHNLNPNQMADILRETTSTILEGKELTDELRQMKNSLNEVGITLLQNQDVLTKAVERLGGGSDWVAYATVGYCILNLLSPRLGQKLSVVLDSVLPQVKKLTGKSSAGAAIPDVVNISMGLGSEASQKMIKSTLMNVEKTITNLTMDIKALEARAPQK